LTAGKHANDQIPLPSLVYPDSGFKIPTTAACAVRAVRFGLTPSELLNTGRSYLSWKTPDASWHI